MFIIWSCRWEWAWTDDLITALNIIRRKHIVHRISCLWINQSYLTFPKETLFFSLPLKLELRYEWQTGSNVWRNALLPDTSSMPLKVFNTFLTLNSYWNPMFISIRFWKISKHSSKSYNKGKGICIVFMLFFLSALASLRGPVQRSQTLPIHYFIMKNYR